MAPRSATVSELATYLTTGFWVAKGQSPHHFDTATPITVNLTGLTAEGQALARASFEAWSAVANVTFQEVTSAGAEITFQDSGAAYTAYSTMNGITVAATVDIGVSWIGAYGDTVGTYGFQTYLHEIGHALGLGHGGNYNGSADYATNALFQIDSWPYTVMSYFSQDQNTDIDGTYAMMVTPGMADIVALQAIYGAPKTGPSVGATIWGIGSNQGTYIDAVFEGPTAGLRDRAMVIYDISGTDTVVFSNDTLPQVVDLEAGRFSSVYGEVGNLGIALGTTIENYTAGSGSDRIAGNGAANTLTGNAGHDTLDGRGGSDRLVGGVGNDSYVVDATGDVTVESAGQGTDQVTASVNWTLGVEVENLTLTGSAANGDGNAASNRIAGNALANRLQGFEGHDSLMGGDGNDALYGHAGNDTLDGGSGRDLLDGGTGADKLTGGSGDDTYLVDDARDWIVEATSGGIDLLRSAISLASLASNVENLLLLGSSALSATGNTLANTMTGNAGANSLRGGSGNDVLKGDAGNDKLFGETGADTMDGGAGSDLFHFSSGRDRVNGFQDNADTLLFDDALWGGGAKSASQLLAYADQVGTTAVFDFGNGHVLTVENVSNLKVLGDDLGWY